MPYVLLFLQQIQGKEQIKFQKISPDAASTGDLLQYDCARGQRLYHSEGDSKKGMVMLFKQQLPRESRRLDLPMYAGGPITYQRRSVRLCQNSQASSVQFQVTFQR